MGFLLAIVVFDLDCLVFVQDVEAFDLDCVVFDLDVVGLLACPFFFLLVYKREKYSVVELMFLYPLKLILHVFLKN